jgi:GTP pyrophosphokinase
VALGDVGPHQVGRALLEHERAGEDSGSAQPPAPRQPRKPSAAGAPGFTVVGMGNLLVQIARCCQPLPGEPIAGYLTRARGVTVHRADCAAFLRLSATQPQRVLPVEWGRSDGGHAAGVLVEALDRKHLLKDLTNLIAQEDAHVLDIHSESQRGHRVRLRLRVRVQDFGQLARLLGKIEQLSGVEATRRA